MTSSSLEEFYSSGLYRIIYTNISKEEEINSKYSNIKYLFSKPDYKTYHEFLSHDFLLEKQINFSNVAEIGCGYGLNLKVFQTLGKKTFGLEPDKEIEEFTKKKKDINIKQGFYHDLEGKFDLIFAKHVFEHLPDPRNFLRRIKKILKNIYILKFPEIIKNYSRFKIHITFFFLPILLWI